LDATFFPHFFDCRQGDKVFAGHALNNKLPPFSFAPEPGNRHATLWKSNRYGLVKAQRRVLIDEEGVGNGEFTHWVSL
jgi:hypothetical protein